MELHLKKEAIQYYEAIRENPTAFETTQEAIVPDYCADVARIVDTSGVALLHSRELTPDGRVEVSGVIKATILFVPETEREVSAVHISMPYHTFCESRALTPGDRYQVTAEVRSIDARLLNPRKLLARADIAVGLTVYKEQSLTLCTAAEEDGDIQKLEDQAEATVIVDTMEREFHYADEMTLSASRREMREILDTRTSVYPAETKLVGSKLVMKGIIRGEVLYRDEAGEIGTLSQEFLFSQILETNASEETGQARVSFTLTGFEYTIGSDADREDGHTVTMSLHIRSDVELLERKPLHFLTDLYSISKEAKLERKTLSVLEDVRCYTKKQNLRELVETGVAVKQVADAWVRCGGCTSQETDGTVMASAPITIKVLYIDENDSLLMAEKEITLRGETDVSDGSDPTITLRCGGEVSASPTPEGVEVRFAPEFCIDTGVRLKKLYVSDGTLEEPEEPGGPVPSIVLKKAGSMKLWELAKAYHTTGKDILAANQLESEGEILPDRLLLIPRRR